MLKGAADVAVASREVFPQILLPIESMRSLPGPKEEEEEDPKAKGKKPARAKVGVMRSQTPSVPW